MAIDKRTEIVIVLDELIECLDITLAHPEIRDPYTDVGRVYLDATKLTLTKIHSNPDFKVDDLFGDPLLGKFKTRSNKIKGLVSQANWRGVLRESHALLAELPGEPGSDPIILPRPPD